MEPVISFKGVSKDFYLQHQKTLKEALHALLYGRRHSESVQALGKVSFTINKGETVGIIGKNGAGKSTALKLIAGVSNPTSGKIKVMGRVAPLISLGAGFHPDLTGKENIFLNGVILGLSEDFIKKRYAEIVEFSGLEKKFIHMPIKYYSQGMYMRLAFSVAMFTEPDILLIDEILAVGDISYKDKCFKKMDEFKRRGVTIIYVSHNLEKVAEFCKRGLYLRDGELAFDGNVEGGIEKYKYDIRRS